MVAAPAFAASVHDADGSQQTAVTASTPQQHTYSYSSDEGSRGAIATRHDRMHRAAMERSPNARAAWARSVHYY